MFEEAEKFAITFELDLEVSLLVCNCELDLVSCFLVCCAIILNQHINSASPSNNSF